MSKTENSGTNGHTRVGYIAPYSLMKSVISVTPGGQGQTKVEMPLEVFARIFELALRQTGFDEAGYLDRNPDVAKALSQGQIKSAIGHFARNGYFENRPTTPPAIDTSWYLKEYPDVAKSIQQGKLKSAGEHWGHNGYYEGRAPSSQLALEVGGWRSLTSTPAPV